MALSSRPSSGDTSTFRAQPERLPRPRLADALLQADCRLRLLSAPAGSGKTVLLKECAERCPADVRCVYLALRGQRDSGEDFLRSLAQALSLGDSSRAGVRRHLEAVQDKLWIMLDDYPRFPAPEVDELVNDLIMSASRRVSWWLACRRRPDLQLARLLLDAELFELGAGELAFNLPELSALIASHPAQWSRLATDTLLRDSGGWCAGVRIYLLQVSGGEAPTVFPADNRLLQDYLIHEVLEEIPEDWRQALYTLAQLPQFDIALCEQLLGAREGVETFEQLYGCGLFIEPVNDRLQFFRVHPAQGRVLALQLTGSRVRAVYRQVCQWYLAQDQVRPAFEYAVKAGQPELAASLMQRYTQDRILQGRSLGQLMEWRHEMPEDLLTTTPRLVLLNAWALMLSGRLDTADAYTGHLARFLPQHTAARQRELIAQWKALKGTLAFHRGEPESARQWLNEAVDELPERSWSQRLFCIAYLVDQALIDGDFDQALELNRAATREAREHASLAMESVFALGHVKLLELRGELLRAETLLKRLHNELTTAWADEPSPMRGRVQLRHGALLLQQGRYAEATHAFQQGQQESLSCGDPAAFWGYLGLAELDALQGDPDMAFQRVADAERFMQYRHIDDALYQGLLLRAKCRLWLGQGRAGHAHKALQAMPERLLQFSPYGAPDLHLRLALLRLQARLALGEAKETLSLLETLHARVSAEGRRPLACEIAFCQAEALYALGRTAPAKRVLLEALAEVRQLGLASVERAFALRSPALMRWSGEVSRSEEAATLLSRREMEVLHLISQGLSNQQIAETLFISLHTVKTHAMRINAKLGVERRTQALVRAKELGLV